MPLFSVLSVMLAPAAVPQPAAVQPAGSDWPAIAPQDRDNARIIAFLPSDRLKVIGM